MPDAKPKASPAGTLSGVSPRFFQLSMSEASCRAGQRSLSRPSASITCFKQADLVVGIEDGEAGLEADELGVAAQDLDADGVEGAEPRHALDGAADEIADALLHLARRLVGEGDGEDLPGEGAARGEDVGDARRQHARLAGAGAGQNQHRAVERFDRRTLLRVEAVEIGRRRGGAGAEPCSARAEIGCRAGADGRSNGGSSDALGAGRARRLGRGLPADRTAARPRRRRSRVRQMFSALHHRFRTIAPGREGQRLRGRHPHQIWGARLPIFRVAQAVNIGRAGAIFLL